MFARIRSLWHAMRHRAQFERDLDEEMLSHIESRTDDLVRSGLARREAARRARVEFGGREAYQESVRESRGVSWFEAFAQDLRFGARMLSKSPGFTIVAVLTLALGIGANTAVFSVVYAALLRPLPYEQPSRLITLGEARPQQDTADSSAQFWNVSYPDYLDWASQSKAFESLTGFNGDGFVFRGSGEPRILLGAQASTNFFSTLGVKPLLGRRFAAGEDIPYPSGPKVAVLSYNFWRQQFHGDPNVVGRTIHLDANSVTVIGVLPRDFEFAPGRDANIWVPFHLGPGMRTRRNLRWMPVIGRLAPGVTLAQARTEMNAIDARLAAAYPKENAAIEVEMMPLRDRLVGQVRPLLLILFGAVGFVLLIACANVANLLTVRASVRRREFLIRSTLGASRSRLASQLLAESMLLAVAGGAFGFLIAQWGTAALIVAIPQSLLDSVPFLRDAHANGAVFAFLCVVALSTGVVFGLAPALHVSSQREGDALKEESRASAGETRTRLRDALVVTEIAFSLVLLVGAGLMVQSLVGLLNRNPGFDTRNLLTFSVYLPDNAYPKDPDAIRFNDEFMNRVRTLPGVAGITTNSILPLTGGGNTIRFVIEGQTALTGHEEESYIRDASASYFSVMRIPLVAGRTFNDSADSATSPQHVIVNQAWTKRYLPGQDPIGKRIKFTFSPTQKYREIVGVVGDDADASLDSPYEPILFMPFDQSPDTYVNYAVRTTGDPAAAVGAIRAALHDVDPNLFLIKPLAMEQIIAQSPSVFLRRYPSYLIGTFAGLALVLATIGLYGLISFSVSQRTRELGIRVALGAQREDILRLVLGHGVRLALIGLGAGLVVALALSRLMRTLLFGVSAADPVSYAAAAVLLAIVALAACYIPARRAMRVDPVIALRHE
jgi:putative ABC transport system permease protein